MDKKVRSFSIGKTYKDKLQSIATKERRSLSNAIDHVITKHLEENGSK